MRYVHCLLLIVPLFVVGCAAENASEPTAATSTAAPHAECLVCKANADLACVDIPVKANTPKVTYNGKDYYFCSKECQEKFAKDPAKYASKQ
jgi:YHS domain-containing protein